MTCTATPRNKRRLLLAGGLLLAVPGLRAQGVGMNALANLAPAPPLRLSDIDGKTVDLAGTRGRVVLLNFWASWCPPCRKEFPSLGRVRKLFKQSDFEVIAINVGEDPDTVFAFAGTADFPILMDRDSQAMASWPVKALPTTFLIDRQGRLAMKAIGGREFDDPAIVSLIKNLL
jgi:thiol-disulfide isomerase/thioredoxin